LTRLMKTGLPWTDAHSDLIADMGTNLPNRPSR
jgi:hypothetical protein